MKKLLLSSLILLLVGMYVSASIPEKPIVVITASYNNAEWYERNLNSILEQDYDNFQLIYIDDCSSDSTGKLVATYLAHHPHGSHAQLICNKRHQGHALNQWRAIHSCDDEAIIIIVDGDDWLENNQVFKKINQTYTDNNVWLTYGQFITHPDGNLGCCRELDPTILQSNTIRKQQWTTSHLRTFYAWLFKELPLKDLMYVNKIMPSAWDLATMIPMIEMAGEKIRFIPEILYVYNNKTSFNMHKINEQLQRFLGMYIQAKKPYKPLEEKTVSTNSDLVADIIIFSESPDQLEELLRSINNYLTGVGECFVLFDALQKTAYEKRASSYPNVTLLPIDDNFQESVASCYNTDNNYVMFARDGIVVTQPVHLTECTQAIKQSHAWGFYLRLGKDITSTPPFDFDEPQPHFIEIKDGILAWRINNEIGQWTYQNNFDLTIYPKNVLRTPLNKATSFGVLVQYFNRSINFHNVGLCFEESKVKRVS